MARLYTDEDFISAVAAHLRELGHDVLTTHEAETDGDDDELQLQFAIENNRANVTFNLWDFVRLHRKIDRHQGIIVCTRDDEVEALVNRIHSAIISKEPLENKLMRVYKNNLRVEDKDTKT
jgi:hypothetical protein